MAAAMFKHELRQRGLGDVVRVSSAGTCITCADHGPADERAFWVLHRHGYRVPLGHRTQLLNADRLNADLVVAFGAEHVDLLRKWGVDDDRIRCLHAKNPHTLRQFEDAYGRIEAAMPALLAWVEQRRPVWWRWWKLTPDGVLASPIGGYRWETADYKAFCPHPIKGSCSCGVYAFTSAADCHAHIDATGRFAPDLLAPSECAGVVLGRVQLSADAYLAKAGLSVTRRGVPRRGDPVRSASPEWLASGARIMRLRSTGDQALDDRLAQRYGVPVFGDRDRRH
ncbi:hypothetical protein H7J83_24725 [Mycobacterium mantenii]|nr:hypothetical protein [Mycobacterium mantenii]